MGAGRGNQGTGRTVGDGEHDVSEVPEPRCVATRCSPWWRRRRRTCTTGRRRCRPRAPGRVGQKAFIDHVSMVAWNVHQPYRCSTQNVAGKLLNRPARRTDRTRDCHTGTAGPVADTRPGPGIDARAGTAPRCRPERIGGTHPSWMMLPLPARATLTLGRAGGGRGVVEGKTAMRRGVLADRRGAPTWPTRKTQTRVALRSREGQR